MPRRCLKSSDTAPAAAATGTGAGADASSPPSPHFRWNLHGSAMKVAVAGNVIVVFLFFAVVVWRLFFAGRGQEGVRGAAVSPHGADGDAASTSSSGASTPCASPRKGGLGKEDLLALPVFVHGASSPEIGEGKAECAVCISELRDGDTGRLLPRCGHRFHAECVDRWFRSHVTCPLCRAVVADGGAGQIDSKVASVV